MDEKIRQQMEQSIVKIGRDLGISNLSIIIDNEKYFTIYIPYLLCKDVSSGIHPDFISSLKEKKFEINMILASRTKGLTLAGAIKRNA